MGRSSQSERGDNGSFGPDGDDSGCHILHVDMDAFFASVEVRARPELRGKPVIVGGTGLRGVVSAASYEARAYGVRSAMPTVRARSLCPGAIFLPPNFTAYQEASQAVMAIFADVTPLVEPLSVDEAFLDVAGAERLFGRPAAIAVELRRRIQQEQQLTCSVGVAPTKFVAKLASTRSKPNGLLVIPAARVLEFLHPLPVDALWGVGERSAEQLRRYGLRTVSDVAHASPGLLRSAVGQAAAAHLQELAWGRDPRVVDTQREEKSISAEITFPVDVTDPAEIRQTMLALAGTVGTRLRKSGQSGRTIAIKVRYSDFHTINRSRTLPAATDVTREIFEVGWALFEALQASERIRLVGVRVEGLGDSDDQVRQLSLGEPERGWRDAEAAVDAASARYGRSAIRPASLLGREERR